MRKKLACLLLAGAMVVGATACEEDDVSSRALFTEQVLFEVGEHELTNDGQSVVADAAEQIRSAGPGGTVTIAGHTDDRGGESVNQPLSERRAEQVHRALAELLADVEVTYQTEGYGAAEPQAPNDSEENRAQNRRVDIAYWP